MTAISSSLLQDIAFLNAKHQPDREQIGNALCNLYSYHGQRFSDREQALMVDILEALLLDVEKQMRQKLADRLLQYDNPPASLIQALCNDDISVARPLLLYCPQVLDTTLLEIIRHRGEQHQLAIAMRKNITEMVSDALVETGNSRVITVLLENHDAAISHKTLEYLAYEAERVDAYRNPLLAREDLPSTAQTQLENIISDALKSHIHHNFAVSKDVLEDALPNTTAESPLFSVGLATLPPEELVAELAAQQKLSLPLMLATLMDGEIPLFEAMFARLAEVPLSFAQKTLATPSSDVFAIVCKAIGMEKQTFFEFYDLLQKGRPQEERATLAERQHSLKYFMALNQHSACAALHTWQRETGMVA